MAIQLYRKQISTTSISNRFIDDFMPDANGEFVKVYLYLLRRASLPEADCTVSGIADALSNTEADVMRALRYWERIHVLALDVDGGEIYGIHIMDDSECVPEADTEFSPAQTAAAAKLLVAKTSPELTNTIDFHDEPMPVANVTLPVYADLSPDPGLSDPEPEMSMDDDSISELFAVIQAYLGARQMTSSDMKKVLYWVDTLNMSKEMILYLVESCVGNGHTSLIYMDKIALSWHQNHITTVAQAKEETTSHSKLYYNVLKAFGISGRSLGGKENELLTRWTKELGFDSPIIIEACNRTMSAIHRPSFEYTDRILKDWHSKNVHSLEDIRSIDKNYQSTHRSRKESSAPKPIRKTGFSNFDQRNYDYDQLEKMLLNTTV